MPLIQTYTFPIVGAHYRPPAKAILAVLPAFTPLLIVREPDNEFDSNAVKVTIATENIPEEAHQDLSEEAHGYGFSLENILDEPLWHLGYIPAAQAANLSPMLIEDFTADGRLTFTQEGKPAVTIRLTPRVDPL